MNNVGYTGYNPYLGAWGSNTATVQPTYPQQQVTRVNGQNGANAYAMGPNSSALLLDEGGLILWVVSTDGAGYKTVMPYDITPHKDAPAQEYASLDARLRKLEEKLYGNAADSVSTGAE